MEPQNIQYIQYIFSIPAALEGKYTLRDTTSPEYKEFISQEDMRKKIEFIPQKETKERMSELGIEKLLETKAIDILTNLPLLEVSLWKYASKVKKRRFGYEKKDFDNSLKFLEIFCLYSGEAIFSKGEHIDRNVFKAIEEIKVIKTMLEVKVGKTVLKQHINKLNHLINKIFTGDLTGTEQIALAKVVEKAETILEKIVK